MVFNLNMILYTSHIANWEFIQLYKQVKIDLNNEGENRNQILYIYKVGDYAYLLKINYQ